MDSFTNRFSARIKELLFDADPMVTCDVFVVSQLASTRLTTRYDERSVALADGRKRKRSGYRGESVTKNVTVVVGPVQ